MCSYDVVCKRIHAGDEPRNRNCLRTNSNNTLWLITHKSYKWVIYKNKFTLFSSSIPFLIAKDLITRLSSMSTIVATRIFAKVGMQSYSITVFVSGDKYSETGPSLVCRERIWRRFTIDDSWFQKSGYEDQSECKDPSINLNLDLSKISILLNNNLILYALELILKTIGKWCMLCFDSKLTWSFHFKIKPDIPTPTHHCLSFQFPFRIVRCSMNRWPGDLTILAAKSLMINTLIIFKYFFN